MIAIPRPLVRNSLFILVTIVVMVCIQDRVFTVLEVVNDLYRYKVIERNRELNERKGIETNHNEKNGTTKRELVLLQMLFRHGHRAPFMIYPTDPNPASNWKGGLAMLTQLGRLQHYVLGLHLQERYKNFITTNPNEIEMSNSDNFRCQLGVYAFVAGLYSPTKEYRFTDEIQWQPIISRHQFSGGNFIFTRHTCKISDEECAAFKESREASEVKEKYKGMYEFWSEHSGRLIDNWVLAADLGKTLACERDYNMTIPDWGFKYWDEFRLQSAISYYFNFGTKLIQRYRIGPLIGFMIDNINKKILNRLQKRVIIYSAHGSNIATLLLALENYNWLGPPHASTVILELWKENEEDYSIRWLYFNSTNPEKRIDPPYPLILPGCGGEFCPLSTFEELMKPIIPVDWREECNNESMRTFFKRFERNVYVSEVLKPKSSSSKISLYWTSMSISLICIYITGKIK